MANGTVQVSNIALDKGLDYVTPPLLAPAGTLVDTRNYELSSDMGYRRIDGYERRDNWPDGGISKWYSVTMTGAPSQAVGDKITYSITSGGMVQLVTLGIIVAIIGNEVRYVAFDNSERVPAGQVTSAGTALTATVDGRTIITDPATYIGLVRTYSAVLRALVTDAPYPIAGTYYSRDRSFEAINLPWVEIAVGPTAPPLGETVRLNGVTYLVMRTDTTTNPRRWYLMPDGTTGTVSGDIVSTTGSGTTYATAAQITTGLQNDDSLYAYMTYVWEFGSSRTHVNVMTPATDFLFNTGTQASGIAPPLSDLTNVQYYVTTPGGANWIKAYKLSAVTKTSGSWAGGTAEGRMQLVENGGGSFGTRDYLINGDEIHTSFPITGSSLVAKVASVPTIAVLAGTRSLRLADTRYQWGTFNFYGKPTMLQTYGTNGVFRAFWANASSYGNIFTQEDATLDNPKYINFHAGVQLGLGFSAGSFQLSVGGEPYNFNGLEGALEIATGDDITGLLEAQDDSTLIFGTRSIRRVTGTTDTTLALATISANAGCFDYTAVNVGTIPVFTGPTGVSTLSQTDAYGDFIGERATSRVYNWLNPKLVPGTAVLEQGGVACAIPIRNKNQYRLFLKTGDVVSVTFSSQGTQVMRSNYSTFDRTLNVPFAWGSSVSDTGDEHIEIVWDLGLAVRNRNSGDGLPNPRRCYRMDWGWGFDGEKFNHYFDVSWAFPTEGDTFVTPEHIRLYGMNYGIATLNLKTSGIEEDFDQAFYDRIQDISMPRNAVLLRDQLFPVTGIIDSGGWGLGIKFRVQGYEVTVDNVTQTEPIHIVQVAKLLTSDGKDDH